MEGLGALGINWKILLGQIVNFLILLFVLRKFLYRPIIKMLQERKSKIAKSFEDAKTIERKLAETDAQSREKLSAAVNEAQKIIDEAHKQVSKESQAALTKSAEQAKKIIENAKSAAEGESRIALDLAKKDLAELVTIATEKILEEKQNAKEISQAIQKI